MEYCLRFADKSDWKSSDRAAVRGSAFIGGEKSCLRTGEILEKVCECHSVEDVVNFIDTLEGHYAIICDVGEKTILSVDHIRSIPLFYTSDEDIVGDSARKILGDISSQDFDPLSEIEYLQTMYVTGSDTLHPRLKQVEAGDLVILDNDSDQVDRRHHTRYLPQGGRSSIGGLEDAVDLAISRLCEYADGRPIWVLLSGGNDSRLILSKLLERGYGSLKALSFGRENCSDVVTSERIANATDVEREFVRYDRDRWHDWFHSDERSNYYQVANNIDSLPGFQAGPALSVLHQRGAIPDDVVFVTGQTIASIGEHLPKRGFRSRETLVRYIYKKHYKLWGTDAKTRREMHSRIHDRLENTTNQPAAYEHWEWKERQSKFMSQDGLIYSFYGYDWWFPLFDPAVMDAWESLDINYRRDKSALITITEQSFDSVCDGKWGGGGNGLVRKLKDAVSETPIEFVARQAYNRYQRHRGIQSHPLAYYGMMDDSQPEVYTGGETHHSYRAMHATGRMTFDPPQSSEVPSDGELSVDKITQS